MYNIENIFLRFLQEILINTTLQKKSINHMRDDLSEILNKHIKKDKWEFINKLDDLPTFLSLTNISSTFNDISLRSFVVMQMSIFEFYLWEIVISLWKSKKLKYHENIEIINRYLNVKLADIVWNEIYIWLKEFSLRRNLYVHNNGIIDDNYLQLVKKLGVDNDIHFDYTIHKKWNRLEVNSYMYILMKNIWIIWILFIISSLIVNKNLWRKKLETFFIKMWTILLNNPDNEHIIASSYRLLNKKINLINYIDFTLIYINSLYLSIWFYKRNKQEKELWKDIYNTKLQLILNNKNLLKKQLIYFYALNNDSNNFTKLICSDLEVNKTDDLIISVFGNNLMWRLFIKNSKIIVNSIKKSWVKINGQKINDLLLKESTYSINLTDILWKQ